MPAGHRSRGAGRARLRVVLLGVVALSGPLAGCAGPEPFTVLEPGAAPQADAEEVAQDLELVISELELRYAVADRSTPAQHLGPLLPVERAAEELTEHVGLGSQAQAYVSAHAAYLDDEWEGGDRPRDVRVETDEVAVVGELAEDPVARVLVTTTYEFDDAPPTTVSAEYAISWSRDDERLAVVYPLYDDAGRPAVDSGEGQGSPAGAVHDYLRAVTHGSDRDVDELEGAIHTSRELRAALKAQLVESPRYTPVEIPTARSGDDHVLYYVPATGAKPLRFEVGVTADGPVVVPHL